MTTNANTDDRPTVRFASPNPDWSFDMPANAHDALISMLRERAAIRQA